MLSNDRNSPVNHRQHNTKLAQVDLAMYFSVIGRRQKFQSLLKFYAHSLVCTTYIRRHRQVAAICQLCVTETITCADLDLDLDLDTQV